MEGSRIPKHCSKAPSQHGGSSLRAPTVTAPTTSRLAMRPLSQIPENGIAAPSAPGPSRAYDRNLLPHPNRLRRRSKSVTDLTTTSRKPTVSDLRQPLNLRVGQKRPAAKTAEDVKPKIAKTARIPDWDYKSRFYDLLGKHKVVKENVSDLNKENQVLKEQTGDYAELKENYISLAERYEILLKREELQAKTLSLQAETINSLQVENVALSGKVSTLETSLRDRTVLYAELQGKHKRSEEIIEEQRGKLDAYEQRAQDQERTVAQLKKDNERKEALRRLQHNIIQDLKGNIRVFCRVRPPINDEEYGALQCNLAYPDEYSLEIAKSRESICATTGKPNDLKLEFKFDRVFPPESTQQAVFEELAQLVQSAIDGYHVCVFAYGQTGSGKTFTMLGGPTFDSQGMIPRTIDLMFDKVTELSYTNWTYTIKASFMEIYNENIRDLLQLNAGTVHEIKYNEGRGVTVTNLQIVEISSADQLRSFMNEAHKNRAVAATDFNEHSSRSHAITKIYLDGYNKSNGMVFSGSLNLVDLAGSESAKTSSRERIVETKNINKSLSTLGNVMLALYNKDNHIPYRNSKLTFLLQSCLGGNSKTLMFVNISPFEDCHGETVTSLRFASKVKEVKTNVKKNKSFLQTVHTPNGR